MSRPQTLAEVVGVALASDKSFGCAGDEFLDEFIWITVWSIDSRPAWP